MTSRSITKMFRLMHTHSLPADTLITGFHSTPTHTILADDTGHIHIFSASGTYQHSISVQEGPVWAVATIPRADGNTNGNYVNRGDANSTVIAAGADGIMRAYAIDLRTSEYPFASGHVMPVRALLTTAPASSATVARSLLISSDTSGLIVIWDVHTRAVIHILRGHSSTVPLSAMLVLAADEVGRTEALLISGSYDGRVRTWGLSTGKELRGPKAGEDGIREETLERTQGTERDGMEDEEAKLTLKGEENQQLKGDEEEDEEEDAQEDENRLNAILTVVNLGGGQIAMGGMGGIIRIWDLSSEFPMTTWCAHSPASTVNHLIRHPSGLISAGTDGRICLWDMETFNTSSTASSIPPPSLLGSIQAFDHAVTATTLLDAGNDPYIISGGKDGGDADDVCGLDAKVILWKPGRGGDAADGEVGKGENDDKAVARNEVHLLGGPAQAVWRVQSRGQELLVAAMRRGRAVLELWGFEEER